MTDPKILPEDPTIGELVGDGDTTPPDAPPDPLDPDAPRNSPEAETDPGGDDGDGEEKACAGIDVGPVTVGVESDLRTSVVGTLKVSF